jgi:SAM-dependent methyltransferase
MIDTGAVPSDIEIRDRYLAPALFHPFADDMARRIARLKSGPLLEIDADVGALTQAAALVMAADQTIIATDPEPDTVSRAAARPGMGRIVWQRADSRNLPFREATFGIVACLFGAAAMPDRGQAFAEVRRVMKPGGRFLFAALAHIRHNPVADCIQAALDDVFPADPPRFLDRVMHGYTNPDMMDDDLTAAGFTDAVYTAIDRPCTTASAREAVLGYCLGTPLRQEIEARSPGRTECVIDAVAAVLERRFGSGPIKSVVRAQVVLASG